MEIKEKDKCIANPNEDKHHEFKIIRGTGALTGVSTWICKHCSTKIKSN